MQERETLTDKTIILDLDNCLLVSFFECDSEINSEEAIQKILLDHKSQHLRNRIYKSKVDGEKLCGVKREGLDAFLSFCFKYFRYVIVWSAGDSEYVNQMVETVFRGHHRPDYVLSRDHLVNVTEEDYHKPIEVVEKLYPGIASLNKTVFLDDKEDNFRNNPGNGFTIPQCRIYEKNKSITVKSDTALKCFMNWLKREDVVKCTDITKLNKKSVFTYTKDHSNEDHLKSYHKLSPHVSFYAPMSFLR